MQLRLSLLAICSLLLGLLSPSTPANSLTANLEVIAVTDSKPGEVELTFISKISNKRSYQITAKPKSGVGLTFTKRYTKKAPGYITHKISPLSPEVDYIFTITATTTNKRVIRSAPYNYLVSSTVPSTPLITKVEATDADEAVVFFVAPKDDGGTPIYYYTITSNPGAISVIAPIQGSGSVTVTGLTKATTYTFTLTAHNINGSSRAATSPAPITTLAEKIVRTSPASTTNAPTLAAPAFTLSSSSQSVIVNTAITTVINSSTGGAIASYAISPAAPAGLTFSTSTGQLSGTPTSTQSATNYTITATNAAGSATQTFTLTVTVGTPAFSLSSVAETRVATTAITGYTITSTGAPITSYSYEGTLPSGLAFSTSTGRITGTPTETRTATTYTIIGASASGETATATYRLRVTGDIGDTGPGGGIIYYYRSAGFNCGPTRASTCRYLEAAPSGWNTGIDPQRGWANTTYEGTTVNNSTSPETATATAIGWGYRNTRAIILQGNSDTATSAAALADSHTVTVSGVVYDDWFLPSKDELNELYLQRTTVGGFVESLYWSSSERFANSAWSQWLTNGNQAMDLKNGDPRYVRPVRAF
jgi:Putative Ig domain